MPVAGIQPDEEANLIHLMVAGDQMPSHLYKYRGVNDNTYRIFKDAALWFADPKSFNDPFDCQLSTDSNNTVEEIEEYLQIIAPELDKSLAKGLVANVLKEPDGWDKLVNSSVQARLSNIGVGCFIKEPDNILMWSHYADSHTGLCLKFDVIAGNGLFFLPQQVLYQKKYPVYNHALSNLSCAKSNLIECLLLTKAKKWKYEKEWRVIKFDGAKAHPFEKEALTEVIFGCRASDEFINKIKSLALASGFHHLVYKKAEVSRTEFALTLKELA